jgi:glycosyltransferase involved in cell wall biosynthesis
MVPHHDQDSGSVRMMALLSMLVELGHRVTFLPDNLAGLEPYTTELQQLGIEVLYGPSEFGYVERYGHEFDCAILCRAHFALNYLPGLRASRPRPFIVFDTVDLHFLREQRRAELENDRRLADTAEKTRAVEVGVMRDSDMVWVTSTHEADLLRRDTSLPPVEIIPNIHSVRTDVPGYESRRDMLFIGGFRHTPNEDAVIYFVNEILPRVVSSLPGVRFVIVGSHMPQSIERLASDRVVVRGFVPDVEPVFDGIRLTVAPLRYGAGVKGKVTQSLAWGVPAVATPIAAEGLDLVDGEHLMIASDPITFARKIVDVYSNEALWTRLSHGGRAHIDANLGYESVKRSLAAMLEQV